MSWPSARKPVASSLSRPARLPLWAGMAAAMLILPLASGCSGGGGFRPMYAASADGTNLADKLARVEISSISGRAGQIVRNELAFQFHGAGRVIDPRYRLQIVVRETIASTLVNRAGDSASQVFNVDATFQVINVKTKTVMFSGLSSGRAGFERFTSIFSNVRAQDDARRRSAQTVARDIKSRLEAFLSGP